MRRERIGQQRRLLERIKDAGQKAAVRIMQGINGAGYLLTAGNDRDFRHRRGASL